MASSDKQPDAFRTIGELARDLGVAQHILRYWETKFPQLKPLQRAGNRRYYRPADVALAKRIHHLLGQDGYTVRGVQKLLAEKREALEPSASQAPAPTTGPSPAGPHLGVSITELTALRNRLREALDS